MVDMETFVSKAVGGHPQSDLPPRPDSRASERAPNHHKPKARQDIANELKISLSSRNIDLPQSRGQSPLIKHQSQELAQGLDEANLSVFGGTTTNTADIAKINSDEDYSDSPPRTTNQKFYHQAKVGPQRRRPTSYHRNHPNNHVDKKYTEEQNAKNAADMALLEEYMHDQQGDANFVGEAHQDDYDDDENSEDGSDVEIENSMSGRGPFQRNLQHPHINHQHLMQDAHASSRSPNPYQRAGATTSAVHQNAPDVSHQSMPIRNQQRSTNYSNASFGRQFGPPHAHPTTRTQYPKQMHDMMHPKTGGQSPIPSNTHALMSHGNGGNHRPDSRNSMYADEHDRGMSSKMNAGSKRPRADDVPIDRQRNKSHEVTKSATFLPHPQAMDYDIEILQTKTYADLEKESFDFNPKARRNPNANKGTLEQQLEKGLGFSHAEKRELFDNLSIQDWDDAGDWFLSKFGDVMNKMRKARQEKRQMAAKHEQKLAERHKLVEEFDGRLNDALGEMRKGGQDILSRTKNEFKGHNGDIKDSNKDT